MPTVQPVEVISSLAHRQGDDVRLVLHLPDAGPIAASSVPVRFVDGERRFRRPATVRPSESGVVLELTVPAKRLGRGIWSLAFRPDAEGPFDPIEARLLTGRRQPISLIPGPVPDTRLPEPSPPAPAPVPAPGRSRRGLVTRVIARARRQLRG